MNYSYSPETVSTHYVIICDETGDLVSPNKLIEGSWDYSEIAFPNARKMLIDLLDDVAVFDNQKEAEVLAKTLAEQDGDNYTVMTIIKERVEYFVLK